MKLVLLLLIGSLLFVPPCFGATLLSFTIEEDGGGDYTSLEACFDANEQDLTTTDKYIVITIQGDWDAPDTTSASDNNYTTDATRNITVQTAGVARHSGKYVAGTNYIISVDGDYAGALGMDSSNAVVDGLCFFSEDSYYNTDTVGMSGVSPTFKNNIITGTVTRAGREGQRNHGFYSTSATGLLYNNIIFNAHSIGIYLNNGSNSTMAFYNNSLYYCGQGGVWAGMQVQDGTPASICINNLVIDSAGADYQYFPAGTFTTNGAGDSTGTAGLDDLVAATEWVSPGTAQGSDFHLKVGATSIGAGTDLSGTFTTDIDGETRSGDWDIGADQITAAPAGRTRRVFMVN